MLALVVSLAIVRRQALSGGGASLTFSRSLHSSDCQLWHDNIEQAFKNENTCETDSDCKVIALGGSYVEFGCSKYVNKGVVEDKVYKELDSYDRKCSLAIDECAKTPTPICVSNRCVASKK